MSYFLQWHSDKSSAAWEFPGAEEDSAFETEAEAWAARDSLVETGEWDGVRWRVVVFDR